MAGASQKNTDRRVKLLVCIVGKRDGQKAAAVVAETCVSVNFISQASGTAASQYLNYFGLNEIEKNIVMCLIPGESEKTVLSALNRQLQLYLNGNGIAFTLSLSGISAPISEAVLSGVPESRESGKKTPERKKEKKVMHELVIAVVNQKFTAPVLAAVRSAGATGATLLHSYSTENERAEQVLGASLTKETDTVAILTTHEFKPRILGAIREVAGLKTDGTGVVFSLAVDELIGIGRYSEEAGETPDSVEKRS